ncbi:uncharacterized protein PITG_04899 [Phytophthora infestans T30-4]|uniref:Uncharacterized protein n=1 Tax=Phytophthora infestans (strain T30-4) TaxID=403677 RepID=D0N2B3_PHYIT|nr:uncharacterized protein PITG_04899 [Phytophthora infestans T30-4]EEY68442.1 conserved hypothetical protein [Phytophthora infestans T30-4]|eukprot:XP_002905601.1 conserved hypothetical protein [Phytophthora infestans T30-4]
MTAWLALHFPQTIDSTTKKMLIPLPKEAILVFLGYICSPTHVCDRDNVSAQDASSPPYSASCIWGYRSALVDVYRAQLIELFPLIDTELHRVLEGHEKLFLGSDSKDRFGRLLRRVIKSWSEEEVCILGCIPEDIGTHSLRKGSSSYALGQSSGPTPVSVYLRMG